MDPETDVMTDIMIDLETMGNGSEASIIQIGAVAFNRHRKTDGTTRVGGKFCVNVNLESNKKFHRDIDPSTIEFWMSQPKEAQDTLDLKKGLDLDVALKSFHQFVSTEFPGKEKHVPIWSHATFDFVILSNAYRATKLYMPYSHRQARDLRTITDVGWEPYWLPNYSVARVGTHHNALDDCLFQVEYCVRALEKATAWVNPKGLIELEKEIL